MLVMMVEIISPINRDEEKISNIVIFSTGLWLHPVTLKLENVKEKKIGWDHFVGSIACDEIVQNHTSSEMKFCSVEVET